MTAVASTRTATGTPSKDAADNSADPWSSFNSDLERVLLSPGYTREQLFAKAKQRFERPGCVLIVKFHIRADTPHRKLSITMYLRTLLEACILHTAENANADAGNTLDKPSLVKYDDERAFCVHQSPSVALRAAVQIKCIVDHCADRFDHLDRDSDHDSAANGSSHSDSGASKPTIGVTCGLDIGPLVLLVGDYYGNAVNIASKLGEDHAEPGQVLISNGCYQQIQQHELRSTQRTNGNGNRTSNNESLLSRLRIENGFVRISKVEIAYKSVQVPGDRVSNFLPSNLPTHDDILGSSTSNNGSDSRIHTGKQQIRQMCLRLCSSNAEQRQTASQQLQQQCETTCTMLQSDMSGFTRLTQRYGIYHFLLLVANCRKIFRDAIQETSATGSIVKYDGDNVIARFDNPDDCVNTIRRIKAGIQQYNHDKAKDYQIRIKLGVAHGTVYIINHDIIGESWEDCCLLGEDTAEVGEVLVTQTVYDRLKQQADKQSCRYTFEERDDTIKHYNLAFAAEASSELQVIHDLANVVSDSVTPAKPRSKFRNAVFKILSRVRMTKRRSNDGDVRATAVTGAKSKS